MLKLKTLLPAVLLGLTLPVTAQQIYQSTDEQGNPTFSDQPAPDSKEVVIEKPNVSEPMKIPPPSATPEPATAPEPKLETEYFPEGELTTEPKRSRNKKKRKKNKRKWRRRYDYEANPHY